MCLTKAPISSSTVSFSNCIGSLGKISQQKTSYTFIHSCLVCLKGTYNWNFWLFIHRDRFNFPTELFCSIRQHHVQVVCEQDFPIVDIAELIDSLTNLNLLRHVNSVNFKLTADGTLTCFSCMQRKGHFNGVLLAKLVRDFWVARIRLQVLSSVNFLNGLDGADQCLISH
jgi:hypothetical protein